MLSDLLTRFHLNMCKLKSQEVSSIVVEDGFLRISSTFHPEVEERDSKNFLLDVAATDVVMRRTLSLMA